MKNEELILRIEDSDFRNLQVTITPHMTIKKVMKL